MNLEIIEQNMRMILNALNNYEILSKSKQTIADKKQLKEIELKIKNLSFYIIKINSNIINLINQK